MNRLLKKSVTLISVLSLVLALISPLSGVINASAEEGVTRDWGKVYHSGGQVTDYNGYTFMDGSYISDVQARPSYFDEKSEMVNHDDSFFGFDWTTIENVTEDSAVNWNAAVLVPYGQVFSAADMAAGSYYFVTSMQGSSVFTRFDQVERLGVSDINWENTGVTNPAAPSGAYNLIAIENVPGTKTAYLHFSTDLIRYSNASDGGYVSDEAYGVNESGSVKEETDLVPLNPQIYMGGELKNTRDFNLVIRNEAGKPVIAGEMCPPGGFYYVTVSPKDSLGEERFKYNFPEQEEFFLGYDGSLVVDIMGQGNNTAVSGTVYDENGMTVSGVTVAVSQKAGGWVSQTCITDEDGKYSFEGLFDYTDCTISVNEREFVPYSCEQRALEPYSVGSCDIWLSHTTPLVTFKLDTRKLDELMRVHISEIASEELGLAVYADGEWVNFYIVVNDDGSTSLCQEDNSGVYSETGTLYINCDAFEPVRVPFNFYDSEILEIQVKPYALFAAELTPAEPEVNTEYMCVLLDAADNPVGSATVKQNADGKYIFKMSVKEAGSYSVLAYENSDDYRGRSLNSLLMSEDFKYVRSGLFDTEPEKTVIVSKQLIVPFAPLALSSSSTIDTAVTNKEKGVRIKINAHLELKDAAQAKALYILTSPKESTMFGDLGRNGMVNGKLVEKSLVINGKAAAMNTSEYSTTGKIGVFEFALPADISLYVDVDDGSDCYITLAADLVMNNGEEKQCAIAGRGFAEGNPLTIEVPERAASETITVSGRAPEGKSIEIYDNDSLIGIAYSDYTGYYETLIRLKGVQEDFRSVHKIKAVCEQNETKTQTLMFDSEAFALKDLWLTDADGVTLSNPILWKPQSVFAARADIDNIDRVKEVCFSVTCSDGTVVELKEARREGNSVYSESYPFGENYLVPINLTVIYDANEPEIRDIGKLVDKLVHNSVFHPVYRPVKSEPFFRNGFVVSIWEAGEEPEEIFEKDELHYTISFFEATADEIRAEDGRGAYDYHSEGRYASGKTGEDGYISFDENGGLYAFIEYDTNGKVTSALKILVQNGNEQGANSKLVEKDTLIFYAEFGIKNNDLSLMSEITEMIENVKYGKGNFDKAVAPTIGDYYLKTIPKNEITRSLGEAGVVGTADAIYSTGKLGYECYNRNNECDEYIADIRQRKQFAHELYDAGLITNSDMQKAMNYYDSAESGYLRAKETNTDTMKAHCQATVVCTVSNEAGPIGETLGVAGNFFTSMVTDDMTVNTEVTKSEAGYDRTLGNLHFAKATGLTQDEINNYLANSKDPVARNIISNKIRNNIRKRSGNSKTIQAIVDPSGFIYEAVASNRIEGAKVAIYDENLNLWDSYNFGQENPLISDSEGHYSWDVPEGSWYVEAVKYGYEANNSGADPAAIVSINGRNFLPVLPPQLDVNIGLTDYSKPVFTVYFGDSAKELIVSSDKYMFTDSFISGITVYDGGRQLAYGSDYTAEYTDAEVSPAHTPICGGQELARTVKLTFNSEPSAYGIEITAKTYAGTLGNYSEGSLADNGEVTPPSNDDKVNASDENEDADEDEAEGKSKGWIIILVIVLLLAGGAAGFFFLRKKNK